MKLEKSRAGYIIALDKSRAGYWLVFERSRTGWDAYPPDLPGCGATGRTLAVTKRRMEWALTAHIRGTRQDRLPVSAPGPANTSNQPECHTAKW